MKSVILGVIMGLCAAGLVTVDLLSPSLFASTEATQFCIQDKSGSSFSLHSDGTYTACLAGGWTLRGKATVERQGNALLVEDKWVLGHIEDSGRAAIAVSEGCKSEIIATERFTESCPACGK